MMTETVVTMDGSSNNTSNNRRQVPNVKSEPGQSNNTIGLRLNLLYFKTLPGIIKIIQLIFGFICMVCATPRYSGLTNFFVVICSLAFIGTILWCVIYGISLRENLNIPINWILSELMGTGGFAGLYVLGVILHLVAIIAAQHAYVGSNVAALVFGFFNALAYVAGTYFLWIEWKNGGAQ